MIDEQKAKEKKNEMTILTSEEIKEIRKAQNIVESAVHPDTGDFIP